MTSPAQPVPVLPLAYASESPRDFSGLRRLRRGLIVLAISRFLLFLLIALELLARGAGVDWGLNTWRVIWLSYTTIGLVFLASGWLVLGVSRSGQRGFSNGRRVIALILTVAFFIHVVIEGRSLFWMLFNHVPLMVLRILPHGPQARLAYYAGWIVPGLWVLVHAWQTLRRVSAGRWLQPLGWTFAATGAVWIAGLLLSAISVFGHWQSASLQIGTAVISERLMNALSLALAVTEAVFALAAGVVVFLAIRSLRRTTAPAAP